MLPEPDYLTPPFSLLTECWWFDVFEMYRRIAMTGGLVLIYRGSMLQICVAIFICSVALPVVARFKPYAILKDDKFKIDNSALAEAFQVGCRERGRWRSLKAGNG